MAHYSHARHGAAHLACLRTPDAAARAYHTDSCHEAPCLFVSRKRFLLSTGWWWGRKKKEPRPPPPPAPRPGQAARTRPPSTQSQSSQRAARGRPAGRPARPPGASLLSHLESLGGRDATAARTGTSYRPAGRHGTSGEPCFMRARWAGRAFMLRASDCAGWGRRASKVSAQPETVYVDETWLKAYNAPPFS